MSDEGPNFAQGSAELLKIMMLVGAALGIFSVFMLWFSMDFVLVQFKYTGPDFLLKSFDYPDTYPGVGYYAYMPWIVLFASAAAVGTSLLSFTKHERKGAAAGAALGVAMLAATLLYVFYPLSKMVVSAPGADLIAEIRLMKYLDAGVYCAVIAAVFLIVGGMIVFMIRKDGTGTQEGE
ncbi:MAG: hypothetical protein FWG60_00540 [Methanomassiliicoccaceae archaeon]|nr:hypothetical protein [Methanomassiliicoccaceae archaeon]